MANITIVSENYFKYDNSDYAKSLRKQFGNDGYKKYKAKMNSIMTNPLTESKKKYTEQKEIQYQQALANLGKARSVWNNYKSTYKSNMSIARYQNNGISLSGEQKRYALEASGDGAVTAYNNFNDAQAEADFALSLLNDATHSGMGYLS